MLGARSGHAGDRCSISPCPSNVQIRRYATIRSAQSEDSLPGRLDTGCLAAAGDLSPEPSARSGLVELAVRAADLDRTLVPVVHAAKKPGQRGSGRGVGASAGVDGGWARPSCRPCWGVQP